MDASNHDDEFNSTTNWYLAVGSLTVSISFESSSTANQESDDGIISAAADHVTKSPLLLLPPVPNGEPCEITITFAQEYELRQVYIRSSARVYEVYYTKKRRQDKEYLCTVRCGVAVRDEEVLQVSYTDSDASKSLVERKVKDNGNVRSSEDDWVEVKAGDDSLLNNEKDLLLLSQLGKQDFYEATAEINDVDPCTSITLRLLSLQDKRCALVDEVYVFADPVDSSESEQEEASGAGNSSSSSLMAMFMPALLQLSRGKDVRRERDREVSGKSNITNPGTLGNSNDSDGIVKGIHQEKISSKADLIGVSPPVLVDTLSKRVDFATRVSGEEMKPATSCSNMETILGDLVNKVSRIETILTRFEDQMLKPINSIDARLHLVEKKLEQLGKKSFESELVCQKKIPNPDTLGCDGDKISDTDELDGLTKSTENPQLVSCTKIVIPESSIEDCAVVLPKNRLEELESENNSISGNEVISTEPETSSEEGSHSFEEKPKRSLSINDALASALAGFLSSHSITDGKYSQAFAVTAPEFSNEDDMEIEDKPRTGGHPDKSQVAENIYSASESATSSQKVPGITPCIEDNSQETIYGDFKKRDDSFGGDKEAKTVVSVRDNALDEDMFTSSTKADCYTEKDSDSLIHELENSNLTTTKCKGEPEMDDVFKSVVGLQPTTSSINFLTSVLDVKFSSENQDSDSKSFFEALFTEESKTDVDCKNKAFDDNLVSVEEEEEELKGPPTDTLSSVEMDHYETNEIHLHVNDETSEASLI
ncbi:hypothetical protein CARUB_v10025928mg [Capsella rubella]|uniref:Uncharacterized protein n=1 Tax=Capsella rubella TaxID=81985 RepID=R0GP53_9BRAS|nr:uncharacterized protein LOC17875825 [Capsella rubella]EOA12948.1 hypothetical protein CARUB_v10025928mg [Capsella rubella]